MHMEKIMEAEKLRKGGTVGIISPAYAVQKGQYDECIRGLEQLGYKVLPGKNLYANAYGYAASEEERASDFNEMVLNTDVKMILFGGGYVSNEILPYIDFRAVKKNPKLFVSYSDGTTLLDVICARTGLITYYGQKPSTFADITEYNRESFVRNLTDDGTDVFIKNSRWRVINPGYSEGILFGGYVENFALLTGSSCFRYKRNGKYILFLEDHEKFSSPARISMYLSFIEQSRFVKNITGLLFGHYSDNPNAELEDRLCRFGIKNNIPVVCCDDYGHGENNGILQIGRKAALNTAAEELRYGCL